jgi:hypothetical protein
LTIEFTLAQLRNYPNHNGKLLDLCVCVIQVHFRRYGKVSSSLLAASC